MSSASFAFAALSRTVRLDVLRLLVTSEPNGLAAGDIAETLGMKQNTMSANLAVLLRSGLVSNKRVARSIIYRADTDAIAALIDFLLKDCCGGNRDLCTPVFQSFNQQAGDTQ